MKNSKKIDDTADAEAAFGKMEKRQMPWADTPAVIFLSKKIDGLVGQVVGQGDNRRVLTQREIAAVAGYEKPNVFSMFKRGETKIPIDKILSIAKAVRVDPGHFGRLVIEQHWPALMPEFEAIFGSGIISANERKLLDLWRGATYNEDPAINAKQAERLRTVISEIKAEIDEGNRVREVAKQSADADERRAEADERRDERRATRSRS